MKDKIKDYIKTNFPGAVIEEDNFREQFSLYIHKEFLFDLCRGLRENPELQFLFLADICSLDWMGDPEESSGRFEVIYNLFSLKNKFRLLLKVRLPSEKPEIDSLTMLWNTADWLEREVYDLMGINFIGHPNLCKIITADELDGHPLRKDYPLTYEIPQFSHNKNKPPEVI